ncbi:hypothetical protein [Effusibacillus lacus]|uniref:Uncharacterized protein n=1 Tax=Effusibacillus lacus TaxID=1348429 RepID=A0A292YLP9_9BACL|nr:hypothetical protein [Effusibacillus lacus]TCS72573.1 hypothetical protein EDD64_12179 [Effusibacillus lacus]GAX90868.1 hypothetical protein EFBL_2510 [Effusibacillus lacus]
MKNERGSALPLTSVLLLAGMIVLGGLFGLVETDYRTTLAHIQATKVHYISEAGIYRAIAKLEEDPVWREGFKSVWFGEGSFSVRVETEEKRSGASSTPTPGAVETEKPPVPRYVKIRSEGHIPPHARKTILAVYDTEQRKLARWTE